MDKPHTVARPYPPMRVVLAAPHKPLDYAIFNGLDRVIAVIASPPSIDGHLAPRKLDEVRIGPSKSLISTRQPCPLQPWLRRRMRLACPYDSLTPTFMVRALIEDGTIFNRESSCSSLYSRNRTSSPASACSSLLRNSRQTSSMS